MNITISITKAEAGGYFVQVKDLDTGKGYINTCRNKRALAKYLAIRAYKPIP